MPQEINDKDKAAPDLRELADIIAAFDASTSQLKTSHDALQAQVAELTGELSRKNQELSETLDEVSALKNYLANILESITDGVLAIDLDRRVVALNQAAASVIPSLSVDREGCMIEDVLPAQWQELGRVLSGALEEKKLFTNVELRFPAESGGTRTLSVSASPIRNEEGDMLGAVETFRDLTDIRELEERAERKDRLAALGEMAAGVAHEIRNPLGGISLYASLMQRTLPPEGKESELAGKIIAASSSLNKIVEDLLTFTRSREPVLKAVPVGHVCHSALELAASELEARSISVSESDETGGERVLLDSDQLIRAFLNVALNAAQAMEPGGALSVCSRLEGDDGARELLVSFADTGPGISEEIAEKIFNPFFTGRKDGTGLGLAITHKIVQDHGGSISVGKNDPQGAVITFRLPVREKI